MLSDDDTLCALGRKDYFMSFPSSFIRLSSSVGVSGAVLFLRGKTFLDDDWRTGDASEEDVSTMAFHTLRMIVEQTKLLSQPSWNRL